MTLYLTFDDVIHIHADRMKRLGRKPSLLRDEEALRGVARLPEAAVYYEGADLVLQAAVLAVGIAHLKPFAASSADNYVTAYAAMETFLELNGHVIRQGKPEEGPDLGYFLRLIAGEHDFAYALASFADRLRRRVSAK